MSTGQIDLKALPSPRREEIAGQSPRLTQSPRGAQNRIEELARNMLTRSGHALLISPRRSVSPIKAEEAVDRLRAFRTAYIEGESGRLFEEALNRGDNRELLAEIIELHRRCTYERIILVKAWGLTMERLLRLDPSILRRLRSSLAWYLFDWASAKEREELAEQILQLDETRWLLLQKHYPPTGLYKNGFIEALLLSGCPIHRILDPQVSSKQWTLLATTPGGAALAGDEFPFRDFWWRPLVYCHMPFVCLLELSEENLACLRLRTTTCIHLLREGFPPSLFIELMTQDHGSPFIWLLDHATPLFRALRLGAVPSLFVTISPDKWESLVERWELIQVILMASRLGWIDSPQQTSAQILRIVRATSEEAKEWMCDLSRMQQDLYALALDLEKQKREWGSRQRVGATWIWISDRIGMPVYEQIGSSTPPS